MPHVTRNLPHGGVDEDSPYAGIQSPRLGEDRIRAGIVTLP